MRAAIVGRHDLHVEVPALTLELVLDAEVGEVHPVVEVGQIVLARPLLDLAVVATGPPIIVPAISIPFLKELLVLTLQLALEGHATDLRTTVAKSVAGLAVGAVHTRVVRQLSAVDAAAERVPTPVFSIALMRFQKLAAVFGEDDAALTLIERYGRDKPFVAQVVQAVLSWVEQFIAWVTQVALGHDAKRADG